MPEELILLKERATAMGIAFSPNIGLSALKAKVAAKLGEVADEAADAADEAAPAPVETKAGKKELTPLQAEQAERTKQLAEQTRLIRLRITNLNPLKREVPGEIVTVANGFVGTVRKYIPFGEMTDNGYHVPFIIYNELKDRKFLSVKVTKVPGGSDRVEQRLVPEFALEVLEPLTQQELDQLARQQAAAAGLD